MALLSRRNSLKSTFHGVLQPVRVDAVDRNIDVLGHLIARANHRPFVAVQQLWDCVRDHARPLGFVRLFCSLDKSCRPDTAGRTVVLIHGDVLHFGLALDRVDTYRLDGDGLAPELFKPSNYRA